MKISLIVVTFIFLGSLIVGCGDSRYGDDQGGQYGNGPLVTSTDCWDRTTCGRLGKSYAADIRASDPGFEKRYFDPEHPELMDQVFSDYVTYGYPRMDMVSIVRAEIIGKEVKMVLMMTDRQGDPISDINAVELRIFDKKNDSELAVLSAERLLDAHPETIHLSSVLDFSGSMLDHLDQLKRSTKMLFSALPEVRRSIVKFSSQARIELDATFNEMQTFEVIDAHYGRGSTALFDGIALGHNMASEKGGNYANLQMVFTDGVENASRISYEALKGQLAEFKVPQIIVGMGRADLKSLITISADTDGLFYYIAKDRDIESSMLYVGETIENLIEVTVPIPRSDFTLNDLMVSTY